MDLAQMLDHQAVRVLNQELASIYHSGGPQIAVLTLEDLENGTIEERATQVFDAWKIGRQKPDDGILLLIAKKERKIRIEVGYGLEGDIPDAYAKRIIEDVMVPYFRKGQVTQGVVLGVQQIAHLARVELKNLSSLKLKKKSRRGFLGETEIMILIYILIFLVIFLRARMRSYVGGPRYSRSYRDPWSGSGGWGGGWGGGGGGGFGGWGGGGGSSGGGGASGGW